nr:hypothetical protein BaRGS_003714 [Batillaria attramentaria]
MVMLKNIWASKVVSIRTKLRIFNSNVKSVLLYGCDTWRTTKTMQQKIQTFLNTCLRRIFNIRWPEKIRNEELWERAGQEPAAKQILRRKDAVDIGWNNDLVKLDIIAKQDTTEHRWSNPEFQRFSEEILEFQMKSNPLEGQSFGKRFASTNYIPKDIY